MSSPLPTGQLQHINQVVSTVSTNNGQQGGALPTNPRLVGGVAASTLIQAGNYPPTPLGHQPLNQTHHVTSTPTVSHAGAHVTMFAQQHIGGAGGPVTLQTNQHPPGAGGPQVPTVPQSHVALQPVTTSHTGLVSVKPSNAYVKMQTVTGQAEIADEQIKKHQDAINSGFEAFQQVVSRARPGAKDVVIDVIQRTVSYEQAGQKKVENLEQFLNGLGTTSPDYAIAMGAVTKLEDAVYAIWNDKIKSKEQVLGHIREILSQSPTAFMRSTTEEKKLPGCSCVDESGNWDAIAVKAAMEKVYNAYNDELTNDPLVTNKDQEAEQALARMGLGLRALKAVQQEGIERKKQIVDTELPRIATALTALPTGLSSKPQRDALEKEKTSFNKELEALAKAQEQLQQVDVLALCSSLIYSEAFIQAPAGVVGIEKEMQEAIARAKKSQALLQKLVEQERKVLQEDRKEHWFKGGLREGANKVPLIGSYVNLPEMPDEVGTSSYAVDAGGAVFGSLKEPARTLAYSQYLQDSQATVPLRARSVEEGIVEFVKFKMQPLPAVSGAAGSTGGSPVIPAPVPFSQFSRAFQNLFKDTQAGTNGTGGLHALTHALSLSLSQMIAYQCPQGPVGVKFRGTSFDRVKDADTVLTKFSADMNY